jgi:hypothetical protein
MRWCFLGSHEIADDERMVLAHGGSQICVPCSQTERGQRLTESFAATTHRLFGMKGGQTAMTSTRYYVEYQPTNGRPKNFTSFESAVARALFIISLSPYAEVLRLWEASE